MVENSCLINTKYTEFTDEIFKGSCDAKNMVLEW